MTIEEFAEFVERQQQAFAASLRTEAANLRLTDILGRLTNDLLVNLDTIGGIGMRNPSEEQKLIYRVPWQLDIHVNEVELKVYGPHSMFIREFGGGRVQGFYQRKKRELQDIYDNIELPF